MAGDGPTLELKGVDELMATLTRARERGPQLLASAMFDDASWIMRKSLAEVPRRDSILAGSAMVEQPVRTGTTIEVRFGYGGAASKYALRTHENPRAGKTGGVSPSGARYRKWAKVGSYKFLERPANKWFPTSPVRMERTMRTLFQ